MFSPLLIAGLVVVIVAVRFCPGLITNIIRLIILLSGIVIALFVAYVYYSVYEETIQAVALNVGGAFVVVYILVAIFGKDKKVG